MLPVTWRRLSVRERHRARHCHRSLACHVHPDRAALRERLVTRLPPCDELNHCSEASRRNEREKKKKTREAPKNKNKTQTRTHSVSVRSTLGSSGEGVRCVVGASRLTELTDLRCVHKDVCMCRSPGCASPCLRCCHRHVAAPCLRFRSPRLRWLR